MLNNLEIIESYINDAYYLASKDDMDNAIEHFFTVRMLLKTSIVNGQSSISKVTNATNYYQKEAYNFREYIRSIQQRDISNDMEQILIIGDSLQLPRPEETNLQNRKIENSCSYVLCNKIKQKNLPLFVETWAQRYFTTDSIIRNWANIIPNHLENTHIIFHVGLNDYVERIFLEDERLGMDLYPEEIKTRIIKFAQQYRKDIINRQLNHSYVPFEQFKKNIYTIITKCVKANAKSVTFVNIISLPSKSWSHTPRAMWNTTRFNMFLYDLEQQNNINVLDLDRLIWEFGVHDALLEDKMHLGMHGINLLADEIIKITQKHTKEKMKI